MARTPIMQRVLGKTEIRDAGHDTPRWEFTGANVRGYGRIGGGEHGQTMAVHRFAWEFYNGPLAEGWEVHHRCENPACWCPDHLEALAYADHRLRHGPATHCPNGHEYMWQLTGKWANGARACQICVMTRVMQAKTRRMNATRRRRGPLL